MEPKKLVIILESSDGVTRTQEVYEQWKYSGLAQVIENIYRIPKDTQSIVFERKLLKYAEDKDKTLGELGIKNNSKIFVMHYSPGG
ncbi:unnamed protein product [Blepharisma stoltei]|uniref:Ubiquitin-like domain-containing protein n=1 Tax=Blepharisma stoltei TaxID=1481888 RepID=A0AAU9IXT1_9CILI|nr:unnamed protein product [Blepharisma stoltei]